MARHDISDVVFSLHHCGSAGESYLQGYKVQAIAVRRKERRKGGHIRPAASLSAKRLHDMDMSRLRIFIVIIKCRHVTNAIKGS